MSITDIIKRRRSIGKMTDKLPTRAHIEQLLEAATHAPNHRKVEPWRLFVLAGKARNELGAIMEQSLLARMEEMASTQAQAILAKERNKPLRSPVLIVVTADSPRQSNVLAIENIEAVAAAVENMLLVAEELGLAAMWRTGDAAYDPHVKAWLGLSPEDAIVAIIYLGYPAIPYTERQPTPAEEKTIWLGWEE